MPVPMMSDLDMACACACAHVHSLHDIGRGRQYCRIKHELSGRILTATGLLANIHAACKQQIWLWRQAAMTLATGAG